MKKQAFQNHVREILKNHSISLDNDDGTTEFEQYGDGEALVDSIFRGGTSSLTINEDDGEQIGGMTFEVRDDVEIEDREIKLYNNSPNVEHLLPDNIEIVPNTRRFKEITHEDMFGADNDKADGNQ